MREMGSSFSSRWFHELDLYPSEQEREDAEKRIIWRDHAQSFWWCIPGMAFYLLGRTVATRAALWIDPEQSVRYHIGRILPLGLTILSGSLLLLWLHSGKVHRLLRTDLNSRGIIVCMRCGYDLRGQMNERCPECGEPFSRVSNAS